MTSKGTKETIVSRLGFKPSSSSKAEAELERVRKENAHLRRKVDELAKRHVRPPDSDKSKLLERILSLETLRERNNQQLLLKEQEMETLRQQLSARGGEVVASLQAQLEQRRREVEQRDGLFQTLSEETGNLKNKLAAVSARCQALETQNGQAPPADLAVVQDQLRDALEKNQQWLVYDQQREAYVKSVLTRTLELEQQLSQADQTVQQQQQNKDTSSDAPAKTGGLEKSAAQQYEHYDRLLLEAKRDLETQSQQAAQGQQELQAQREATARAQEELHSQKEQVSKLLEELVTVQRRCEEKSRELSLFQRRYEEKSRELSSFQRRYEEKSRELEETKEQLQTERLGNRHVVSEERKVSSDRSDRMRLELESMDARLEEERRRSAELLLQVNLLQKSLLSQNEEQGRMAALEQQIQLSAKDFEDEKIDRQTVQHQLHKVLKELRKAREQITRLESAPSGRFSEPSSYGRLELDRLTIGGPTSPSRVGNLLDESFLECPRCQTPYPTSQHRELLAHMDYCLA